VDEILLFGGLLGGLALGLLLLLASLMLLHSAQKEKEHEALREADALRARLASREAEHAGAENRRLEGEVERLNAALRRKGGAGDTPPPAGGRGGVG